MAPRQAVLLPLKALGRRGGCASGGVLLSLTIYAALVFPSTSDDRIKVGSRGNTWSIVNALANRTVESASVVPNVQTINSTAKSSGTTSEDYESEHDNARPLNITFNLTRTAYTRLSLRSSWQVDSDWQRYVAGFVISWTVDGVLKTENTTGSSFEIDQVPIREQQRSLVLSVSSIVDTATPMSKLPFLSQAAEITVTLPKRTADSCWFKPIEPLRPCLGKKNAIYTSVGQRDQNRCKGAALQPKKEDYLSDCFEHIPMEPLVRKNFARYSPIYDEDNTLLGVQLRVTWVHNEEDDPNSHYLSGYMLELHHVTRSRGSKLRERIFLPASSRVFVFQCFFSDKLQSSHNGTRHLCPELRMHLADINKNFTVKLAPLPLSSNRQQQNKQTQQQHITTKGCEALDFPKPCVQPDCPLSREAVWNVSARWQLSADGNKACVSMRWAITKRPEHCYPHGYRVTTWLQEGNYLSEVLEGRGNYSNDPTRRSDFICGLPDPGKIAADAVLFFGVRGILRNGVLSLENDTSLSMSERPYKREQLRPGELTGSLMRDHSGNICTTVKWTLEREKQSFLAGYLVSWKTDEHSGNVTVASMTTTLCNIPAGGKGIHISVQSIVHKQFVVSSKELLSPKNTRYEEFPTLPTTKATKTPEATYGAKRTPPTATPQNPTEKRITTGTSNKLTVANHSSVELAATDKAPETNVGLATVASVLAGLAVLGTILGICYIRGRRRQENWMDCPTASVLVAKSLVHLPCVDSSPAVIRTEISPGLAVSMPVVLPQTEEEPTAIHVYISYARDASEGHIDQCRALTTWLRSYGITSIIDIYEQIRSSADPGKWISLQIEDCAFVLCVCSPSYKECWRDDTNQAEAINCDRAKFEADLIRDRRRRVPISVIPVLFGDVDSALAIPTVLKTADAFLLDPCVESGGRDGQALIRRLMNVEAFVPSCQKDINSC